MSSSSSSTYDGNSSIDWSEKRVGSTLKLFKRPVIKQYFHRGLLWRSSEASEVMSFELFFDLLYGECAYVGSHLRGGHRADLAKSQSESSPSTATVLLKIRPAMSLSDSSSPSA